MAWYREWFGEEYLDLYSHRDEAEAELHVDFVERAFAGTSPNAVLDLACGAGRHTLALRARGYRALGIDLSLTLLAKAPVHARVCGDMRRLPLAEESFDWVLNFFTSFGYFETERENFRVLEEIVRLLRPGGRFLIDLLNPRPAIENLVPRESVRTDGRRIEVERWFEATTQRMNKRIEIQSPAGEPRVFHESVRLYRPEEVEIGLRWAGLEVDQTYGSFEGDPYHDDSPRLIFVGRKS
jgi:SAM-dependent methyltransferase